MFGLIGIVESPAAPFPAWFSVMVRPLPPIIIVPMFALLTACAVSERQPRARAQAQARIEVPTERAYSILIGKPEQIEQPPRAKHDDRSSKKKTGQRCVVRQPVRVGR